MNISCELMVPMPRGSGITGPTGMGCSLALPEQEREAMPSTPAAPKSLCFSCINKSRARFLYWELSSELV